MLKPNNLYIKSKNQLETDVNRDEYSGLGCLTFKFPENKKPGFAWFILQFLS